MEGGESKGEIRQEEKVEDTTLLAKLEEGCDHPGKKVGDSLDGLV